MIRATYAKAHAGGREPERVMKMMQMLKRLPLLVAISLLAAGCATPQESRDYADNPEDATTGDADQPETSVPPGDEVDGNGTTNSTVNGTANETAPTTP